MHAGTPKFKSHCHITETFITSFFHGSGAFVLTCGERWQLWHWSVALENEKDVSKRRATATADDLKQQRCYLQEAVDGCGSFVLSQAADAWHMLVCSVALETTLVWIMWTMDES